MLERIDETAIDNSRADGAEPPDGIALYAEWLRHRNAIKKEKLGVAGETQSRHAWELWLHHLAKNGTSWLTASCSDIESFLGDIQPRSKKASSAAVTKLSHGKPIVMNSTGCSPVTVRRYWRIVDGIYRFAIHRQYILANPATNAAVGVSERVGSFSLSRLQWLEMVNHLPAGHTFRECRNRLALLLMMRCALTVSELIQLEVQDAKAREGANLAPEDKARLEASAGLPLFQQESSWWKDTQKFPSYDLRVRKSNQDDVQVERDLRLDRRTSQALHEWLAIRSPQTKPAGAGARLLIGDPVSKAITGPSLYNISAALFDASFPNRPMAHRGPNALRNTCITIWLSEGVSTHEVMRRCGLADETFVTRLQNHIRTNITYANDE